MTGRPCGTNQPYAPGNEWVPGNLLSAGAPRHGCTRNSIGASRLRPTADRREPLIDFGTTGKAPNVETKSRRRMK